jgi:hypothetical protein
MRVPARAEKLTGFLSEIDWRCTDIVLGQQLEALHN